MLSPAPRKRRPYPLKGISKKPKKQADEVYGVPVYYWHDQPYIDIEEVPVRVQAEFAAYMLGRAQPKVKKLFACRPWDFKNFMEGR